MKKVVLSLTIVGLGSLWIVPNVLSSNNKPKRNACYLMINTGGTWNTAPLVVTTKLSGNRVRDEKGTVKFYSIDAIIKSLGAPYRNSILQAVVSGWHTVRV